MSKTNPFNKLKLPEVTGNEKLAFNTRNAKLVGTGTATFSLPAGYTCPGACDCLAWFDRESNKLLDGPKAEFRCFAASLEALRPNVRKSVDRNLAILKDARSVKGMAEVINMSLPSIKFHNIRVHADGDFFNQTYFLAWMEVARKNPQRVFYAYTKNLPVWVRNADNVPDNFVLTASEGGRWDHLIDEHELRSAKVVYHPDEAQKLGLEIDHDDSHARDPHMGSFALLIHGQQAAGSEASAAIKRLKTEGVKFSYSKK